MWYPEQIVETPNRWVSCISRLQAIGAVTNLRRYAVASGRHWLSGARRLGRIFETG